MTPRPPADDRQDESFRPDRGWPAGQRWPEDEDWPPDEDWPEDDPLGIPWAGEEIPPAPERGGQAPRWRRGALGLAAVAVLAAAAGAALAWPFAGTDHGSPATGIGGSPGPAAPGSSPGATAPGGPGGIITGPGGGSGGAPGSGPVTQMLIIGTVKAVSATSITIGGPGQPVTAAVTSSTRLTGRVTSIRSIAVGDRVSAQIIRSGGKTTALAIQDPAVSMSVP